MDAWQTIVLAFGGNAALLAVLTLLAKSFLSTVLQRDSKRFEHDLKAKTDVAIENLRSELKAKTDAEIERLKTDLLHRTESYKIQLKKSEFFFQKEYEAAQAFGPLLASVIPTRQHPDQEWEEILGVVLNNSQGIIDRLDAYLLAWGTVLNKDERDLLRRSIALAQDIIFYVSEGDPAGYQLADTICSNIRKLEESLLDRIRAQASLEKD